jgi:hypothetical protein
MPLENSFDNIDDLNPDWPLGVDPKSEGANNLRGVKRALQGNVTGDGLETRLQGGGVADAFTVGELLAALKGLLLEVNGTGNPDTPVAVRVLGDAGGVQLGINANGDISLAQLDAAGVAESTRVFLERDGPSIAGADTALYADVPDGEESVTLGQRINFSTVAATVASVGSVVMQGSWGEWLSAAQSEVKLRVAGLANAFQFTSQGIIVQRGGQDALLRLVNNAGGLQARITAIGSRVMEVIDEAGEIIVSAVKLEPAALSNSHAQVADSGLTWRPVGFNVMPVNIAPTTLTLSDANSGERLHYTSAAARTINLPSTGVTAGACFTVTRTHSTGTYYTDIVPLAGASLSWYDGSGSTPLLGTRRITNGGVATIHCRGPGSFDIWGTGIV